jgi:hypothetical protein
MTNAELLEELKAIILDLRDNESEFIDNPERQEAWDARRERCVREMEGRSSKDMLWLNDAYAEWFANTIKVPEALKSQIDHATSRAFDNEMNEMNGPVNL